MDPAQMMQTYWDGMRANQFRLEIMGFMMCVFMGILSIGGLILFQRLTKSLCGYLDALTARTTQITPTPLPNHPLAHDDSSYGPKH
jgi:hypothetical protein